MENLERKQWLENAIELHIKNNKDKDSVDIVNHFKLRADITLNSLAQLVNDNKVIRVHSYGFNYVYECVN